MHDVALEERARGPCFAPTTRAAVLGEAVALPRPHCDERYATLVPCAHRLFLFTRREVGSDMWETMARAADASGARPALAASRASWSLPVVTLNASLKMSHNLAVMCVANRTLVAFGGQAVARSRAERGIFQRSASALRWPLAWGEPTLALSGNPRRSGCVEERPLPPVHPAAPRPPFGFTCEFDGKLSVVRFNGKVLLFSRSNRVRGTGARHVQVAFARTVACAGSASASASLPGSDGVCAVHDAIDTAAATQLEAGARRLERHRGGRIGAGADAAAMGNAVGGAAAYGVGRFSRFEQLEFAGGYEVRSSNNIYFFTARPLWGEALLGLYPAVIQGAAGVFCSTSTDGVRWSAPVRIIVSTDYDDDRTRDHPVDLAAGVEPGDLPDFAFAHKIYLHVDNAEVCSRVLEWPHLCSYRLGAGLRAKLRALRRAYAQGWVGQVCSALQDMLHG